MAFRESVAFVDVTRADTDAPVVMDAIVAHHLSIVKTVEARRRAAQAIEEGQHDQGISMLLSAADEAEMMGLDQAAAELRHDATAVSDDAMMTSKRLKTRSQSRSRSGTKHF